MNTSGLDVTEAARLAALASYDILDTNAEAAYDTLARLAADICEVPIALVSLVDRDRQWFKANVGLPGVAETDRSIAFCAHTVDEREMLEVGDARDDPRFGANPLVTGDPWIRFYCGMPLIDADGHALGTLCVIDSKPRRLSANQKRRLALLSESVMSLIAARRTSLPGTTRRLSVLESAVEESFDPLVIQAVDATGDRHITYVNAAFTKLFEYTPAEMLGTTGEFLYGPQNAFERLAYAAEIRATGAAAATLVLYSRSGIPKIVDLRSRIIRNENGGGGFVLSTVRDRTSSDLSERRLRQLRSAVENATDLIFVMDAEPRPTGGALTFVNEQFCTTLGYREDEAIGMRIDALFGPGTDPAVIADIREAIADQRRFASEFLGYQADGTALRLEISANPVSEGDVVTSWMCIARDVSDRHRMQEQLLVLSTAFEHASDGIVVYAIDPSGRRRTRKIYVNDALVRSSGFSRDELLEQPNGTGPLTDPATLARIVEAHRTGSPIRERLLAYRKDGSTYWLDFEARTVFDARGRVSHWVTIQRDITESVKREDDLARERETLVALLNASETLFAALDREALYPAAIGAVERVLDATAQTRTVASLVGDPFLERAAQGTLAFDRAAGRAAFALPIIAEDAPAVLETHGRFDEATRYVLELVAAMCATAARNVTLYRELDDQRAGVLELSRVKSDLIAMLAHDFNNPLASIKGHLELLRDGELDATESERAYTFVLDATRRLIELARDTLAYSQLESGMNDALRVPVDVAAVVADVVAGAARPVIATSSGAAEVLGDAVLLREVFANLIGNAIKYSPVDAPVTVTCESAGETIDIRVTDRGIGIPESEIAAVFGRFSRASNAQAAGVAGTGFGLYFVRTILERHGGTVDVSSTVGEGSVFRVCLPKSRITAASRRVVLFEGASEGVSFAAEALRIAGHAVRSVSDPDVVAAIETHDPTALLVLDATSAPGACRALARDAGDQRNRVYVVMPDDRDAFAELGESASFVTAPFTTADLTDALARAARDRSAVVESPP